jgi:threonine aldolase
VIAAGAALALRPPPRHNAMLQESFMNFASDNATGASQRVLDAIVAANGGTAAAYGTDAWTGRAERLIAELFERDCAVFLVATGTAANALALGSVTPPWGAVLCHEDAHVMSDECGAPEMFTAGAKLVGIAGPDGRITPDGMAAALARLPAGSIHQVQPAVLSLSQATECGTVYDCESIARLAAAARSAGLRVHMDGARFANALVRLACTPAQMTWKAGVDVLSFGATKNGGLACEAVVFFDKTQAASFGFQRKRGGHTLSKGRFLGAQMAAYLEAGHWLDLARHANDCAASLSQRLAAIAGVAIVWPTQANEIFVTLPAAADRALKAAGARYYEWSSRTAEAPSREAGSVFVRLVCSFATEMAEIDEFVDIVRRA